MIKTFQGETEGQLEAEVVAWLRKRYPCLVLAKTQKEVDAVARNTVEKEYCDDVRLLAQQLLDEVESGALSNREELIERLEQAVDGHYRVIYTSEAQACVFVSKNGECGLDEGVVELDSKDGIPWSALAYCAFKRDVEEHLEYLGLEMNEDDLGLPERRVGYEAPGEILCAECVPDEGRNAARLEPGRYTCQGCDEEYLCPRSK